MNSNLQGLLYIFVYLDDILVASHRPDEHLKHLCVVFECLQSHGLIVRPQKCEFGLKETSFIGRLVSRDGIRSLPAKTEAVMQFPCLSDSHGFSKFLGLVNYYHGFVAGAVKLLSPLHRLVDHLHPLHAIS